MEFGVDWYGFMQLGSFWFRLVELGSVWCSLVLFGAVWWNLVHFGEGVRKVSFLFTSLKVIFTSPEKIFGEQNNNKKISYSFLNYTVSS